MPPTASPSLVRQVAKLREAIPGSLVCVYDAVDQGVQAAAAAAAFGSPVQPQFNLDKARVILSVESDLLGMHPALVQNAQGFAAHRTPETGDMNRLYVVEAGFSTTGMNADSRLAIQPSQMPAFLASLERKLDAMAGGEGHEHGDETVPYDQLAAEERLARFADVVAHDLIDAQGASLVSVGSHLGVEAVTAGYRINSKLKNLGTTITFTSAVQAAVGELSSLADLIQRIDAGQVESLLILGGNPVFNATTNLELAKAIASVDN